jgi:hypothetical protein
LRRTTWLRRRVRATALVVRNAVMCRLGIADYERWSSALHLEQWWDERTAMIAKLVPPHSRVIEFGAGRRQLETFLPAACTYTPSDLVDRGAGTIVCDLNRRPLPDLSPVAPDVAVFGGVLEYVRDVPSLVGWLADAGVSICVTSFDPVPAGLGVRGRWRESARRSYNGYMNNLTEDRLLRLFQAGGFVCIDRQLWTMPRASWESQIILQLRKRP